MENLTGKQERAMLFFNCIVNCQEIIDSMYKHMDINYDTHSFLTNSLKFFSGNASHAIHDV